MKFKKIFFLLLVLTIIFVYITNISSIPEKIIVFKDENYEIPLLNGISLQADSFDDAQMAFYKTDASKNRNKIQTDFIGKMKLKLTALGMIPIRDISVSVVPKQFVVPAGETLGVKLYSKGVLVVGKSIVEGMNGTNYEPYNTTHIEAGDLILEIDKVPVQSIAELKKAIDSSKGKEVQITYERDGKKYVEPLKPIQSVSDGTYKIGLWVKDGAMGIGTLSFVDVQTGKFAALGHGVSDADTKEKLTIDTGTLNDVKILSIQKGKKEEPGEIVGVLDSENQVGTVEKNSAIGIYGSLDESKWKDYQNKKAVEVASRNEIELGKATILCNLSENEYKEYEIEIQKKYVDKTSNSKCMIIKVTDEELLAKTGGIVQGMSGSPILQNNKLVGAVTHVLLSDPTRGYAVFADMMLEEMYENSF